MRTDLLDSPPVVPFPVGDLSRRQLIGGLATGILLAACGRGEDTSQPSPPPRDRIVPTPFGDVRIPTAPERVVTVNVFGLDAAISIGVVPVGTVTAFGGLEKTVASEVVGTPASRTWRRSRSCGPTSSWLWPTPRRTPGCLRSLLRSRPSSSTAGGLARPPGQDQDDFAGFKIQQTLSIERLAEADADIILLTGIGAGAAGDYGAQRDLLAQVKSNPLSASFGAVKASRAFEVGDHWLGSGLIPANACLDDLQRLPTT